MLLDELCKLVLADTRADYCDIPFPNVCAAYALTSSMVTEGCVGANREEPSPLRKARGVGQLYSASRRIPQRQKRVSSATKGSTPSFNSQGVNLDELINDESTSTKYSLHDHKSVDSISH